MAKIGAAMDWIAAKVGWAADIGKKVGSWFSEDDEPTVTSAPGAPIGSALSFSGSMPASATPQPVANHQASNTNISAPININAPGMDAREVAALIDARFRELMRDSQRNNSAALYD